MNKWMAAVAAGLTLALIGGCTQSAELEGTAPKPDEAAGKTPDKPSMDQPSVGMPANMEGKLADWASDEGITRTIVPKLTSTLGALPELKDAGLEVSVKDKKILVKGKVPNNEVKKMVDEKIKEFGATVAMPADIKVVNSLVVGG